MSTRLTRIAFCTLAVATPVLVGTLPAAAAAPAAGGPALSLVSQTPWVTPASPWFNLVLGVGSSAGSPANLHVSVTVYGGVHSVSQLEQSMNGTPQNDTVLTREVPSLPVGPIASTNGSPSVGTATCITVLPSYSSTPPTPPAGAAACPAGSATVTMNCVLGLETCDDVYPVSIALLRDGSSTPVERFTTFITYQEPTQNATRQALDVAAIMPLQSGSPSAASPPTTAQRAQSESLATLLTANRSVPLTLNVNPVTADDLAAKGSVTGARALEKIGAAVAPGVDQLLSQPYTPIDVAALAGAGLTSEITTQLERGTALLHLATLRPATSPWVDTTTPFSAADGGNLASGLQAASATHLVLNDADLATAVTSNATTANYTFAQPFTLDLGHNIHVTAAAATSQVDARFSTGVGGPTLAADQLLASLEFIHYENPSLADRRGVVIQPPNGWTPNETFITTLLTGLTANPALTPVTLDQFFAQVPAGGNQEPTTRRLQPAAGSGALALNAAQVAHITTGRSQLNSFADAVKPARPTVLSTLSDLLLSSEGVALDRASRGAALTTFTHHFDALLSDISLASERTVTFTSRTAPIPITVVSSAPFTVTVVMSLSSDKFTFPNGSTQTLTLDRATTPVRVQAHSRTSGDRLPVEVTLRTPDGGLTISRTTLTVHSTSISIYGIGLTLLAGLTLLIWWVRTWRSGRRRRPRAH